MSPKSACMFVFFLAFSHAVKNMYVCITLVSIRLPDS